MFNKAVTAAILAIPFLAQSAFAGPCVRTYTIGENEICDGISAAQHVSTYQLAVINDGIIDPTCSNLTPGNQICLGYENEDCSTTYVVKPDDTCEGICAAAGVNSTILYLNNPQINEACDNIYVGEVLCTSQSVQVPPAPGSGAPIPAAVIPATATAAHKSSHTPTATPDSAPSPAPTPEAAVAPTQQTGDDGEDDEDIPFCDEL